MKLFNGLFIIAAAKGERDGVIKEMWIWERGLGDWK